MHDIQADAFDCAYAHLGPSSTLLSFFAGALYLLVSSLRTFSYSAIDMISARSTFERFAAREEGGPEREELNMRACAGHDVDGNFGPADSQPDPCLKHPLAVAGLRKYIQTSARFVRKRG
jgi:hypothetical protein